jgi:hypothetical protein
MIRGQHWFRLRFLSHYNKHDFLDLVCNDYILMWCAMKKYLVVRLVHSLRPSLVISSDSCRKQVSVHFHAGSHFSCPSICSTGFRIVLCVLPRLVYPSSYSSQYGTCSSRRKAHISAYDQSSRGCMRSSFGQLGSVGARIGTSVDISEKV